jgi:hypothetical protein
MVCLLDELEEEEKEEWSNKRKCGSSEPEPTPFDFASFLGVLDGSGEVDWGALDVPGGNLEATAESA